MNQQKKRNVPANKIPPQKDIVLEIEKAIENNPEKLERLLNNPAIQQIVLHKSESYSGPLPHPDLLRKYNELDPKFAETIFKHFTDEQQHRHSIDNKSINGAIKSDKRAQWMAYTLGLSGIALAFYCIYKGMEIAGVAAIIAGLGTLIGAYLKSGKK